MIGDIEKGMIDALTAMQGTEVGKVGYKLSTIKSYGGEFSDGMSNAIKNFPACLIAFSTARVTEVGRRYKISCRFMVMACATNLRNEVAARTGAQGKPGSYQIALDVIRILGNQTFGLEIDNLKPAEIRPLVNDKSGTQLASVYGIDFDTAFYIDTLEELSNLGQFITFHANWDVPAFGNVDEDIPSDDTADATDHTTLES